MLLNANPRIFSETEKFNGTNFATFETLIIVAASSQGVLGCLQGTIPNPASAQNSTDLHYTPVVLNIPLPDNPTPWYSTTPLAQSGPCAMHGHDLYSFTIPKMPLGLALSSTALLQKCGPHSSPNTRFHPTSPWSPLNAIFIILFLLMGMTAQLTCPTFVLNGWQWIINIHKHRPPTTNNDPATMNNDQTPQMTMITQQMVL